MVWNIVWNATATFIAVIIISLLLDESGFFEWAALHVARWETVGGVCSLLISCCWGRPSRRSVANDGAALILSAIVIAVFAGAGVQQAGHAGVL